jgi:DNA-binding NtrC family response regulator
MLGDDFDMPASDPNRGLLRVLFIDDEARILRALKALFRDLEVFITTDPREAPLLAARHNVDVVVCDQRMPEMLGVDVLREIREKHPRAMRVLLTGYSDLKAVLGSVNEGEVYRFVNKPWVNADLRQLVLEAGEISRESPVVASDNLSPNEQNIARSQVGVLVIEDDATVQQRLREILQPHYQVRFANTAERAMQVLEQHETGVVISETATNHGADLTLMLKALKQYHPHIATVVITERANAQTVIELINEGQVYRMLIKPVRMGSCRLSVDSALGRYWKLKQTPKAVRRYGVTPTVETVQAQTKLPNSLLSRIRALPARIFGGVRI